MMEQKYFDQGSEPQIRVISASPGVWYENRIGEIFHATSVDRDGWYSIKEDANKAINGKDVEFGEDVGKKDIKEELEKQRERIASRKKQEDESKKREEENKKVAMETNDHVKKILGIQEKVSPIKVAAGKPFTKARIEYDWDAELIVPDLFVSYVDANGELHKGMVVSVTASSVKFVDNKGETFFIEMDDYVNGDVKVSFPEL
jgi:hypothetical protein